MRQLPELWKAEVTVTDPQQPDVEEIDVLELPEPDEPEEGVIDPADTYIEGRS